MVKLKFKRRPVKQNIFSLNKGRPFRFVSSSHTSPSFGSFLSIPKPNFNRSLLKRPALSFYGDSDEDGVMNGFDCQPFNKRKQGPGHKKNNDEGIFIRSVNAGMTEEEAYDEELRERAGKTKKQWEMTSDEDKDLIPAAIDINDSAFTLTKKNKDGFLISKYPRNAIDSMRGRLQVYEDILDQHNIHDYGYTKEDQEEIARAKKWADEKPQRDKEEAEYQEKGSKGLLPDIEGLEGQGYYDRNKNNPKINVED